MADYTEHYNLELPKQSESYDIEVANANNRIIDAELHKKVEKVSRKRLIFKRLY